MTDECVACHARDVSEPQPPVQSELIEGLCGDAEYAEVQADEWVKPVMDNYLMKCCDCGLVHEMDFRVVRIIEEYEDGTRTVELVEGRYEVQLRARRIDT